MRSHAGSGVGRRSNPSACCQECMITPLANISGIHSTLCHPLAEIQSNTIQHINMMLQYTAMQNAKRGIHINEGRDIIMMEIPLHGHGRDQAHFGSAYNAMEGKYIIPMHVFEPDRSHITTVPWV